MSASQNRSEGLTLLKLGGSLITEKDNPSTVRPEALARLAAEIASVRQARPEMRLVIGHGSGSFGHVPARKYGTRQGVHTPEGWVGFAEVWLQASALTRLVVEALHAAGIPAIVFSPSAVAVSRAGRIVSWDLGPLLAALDAGLTPVVHGDVAFDQTLGGTILSTEDVFLFLAGRLEPGRVLIAGIEPGVFADFPANTQLIETITPQSYERVKDSLFGARAVDVTGGMAAKVRGLVDLVSTDPSVEAMIFSGEAPGNIRRALLGERIGTIIDSPPPDG